MAMLKTISEGHTSGTKFEETGGKSSHTGSVKYLDDYLAYGPRSKRRESNIETYLESGHDHPNRCLAFGKTSALMYEGSHGWSEEMDRTRRIRERTKRKNARTYYHFVISPDPADHVGAEELRDMGLEWIEKCFPRTQGIVSVHDDNNNGIMHAHIVINAVYPETGYRIERSNRDVQKEARALQDICREHGIAAMPNKLEKNQTERRQKWARKGMAEQQIESHGKWSWKQDIRNAVDRAAAEAMRWGKFCYLMGNQGYKVKVNKRGEVTYYHPKSTGHNYRVRGIRLGDAYTMQGVNARLLIDMDALKETGQIVPRHANSPRKAVHHCHSNIEELSNIEKLSTHLSETANRTSGIDPEKKTKAIQKNLDTLAIVRTYGFEDAHDLSMAANRAEARSEELIKNVERTTNTLERLKVVYEKAVEAASLREQMQHFPVGSWSPRVRHQRNELENKASTLEHDVDSVLNQPDVYKALLELGLDNKWQTQTSKVEGLVKLARKHADSATRQSAAEQSELNRIIDASKTMQRGMHPITKKGKSSTPLKLAPGVKVPNMGYSLKARDEVTEALSNLAAAKTIAEGRKQLAAIDKAIEEEKAQQVRQQIQAQQYQELQQQNEDRHIHRQPSLLV